MNWGDRVTLTQYPFQWGTIQMVNRVYEEVNGDAYRLPGPAVYSPREVAHVLCRVRNDRAYRSLLGGGVRRHGSKGGKERKKKRK